jgi:hypothetical protein
LFLSCFTRKPRLTSLRGFWLGQALPQVHPGVVRARACAGHARPAAGKCSHAFSWVGSCLAEVTARGYTHREVTARAKSLQEAIPTAESLRRRDSARIRRGEDSARIRRTRRGFGEDSARIRRGFGGLGEDSARIRRTQRTRRARIRRGLRGLGEDSARIRRGLGGLSEDSARTRRTRRGFGEEWEDSPTYLLTYCIPTYLLTVGVGSGACVAIAWRIAVHRAFVVVSGCEGPRHRGIA